MKQVNKDNIILCKYYIRKQGQVLLEMVGKAPICNVRYPTKVNYVTYACIRYTYISVFMNYDCISDLMYPKAERPQRTFHH
jgi:hypothetical protein